MIKYEDECVDCAVPGYPCVRHICPYANVKKYYCDDCGLEMPLYYFDGEQLCIDCIVSRLEKVE